MSQPRDGGDQMGRIVRAVGDPSRRAILQELRGTGTTTIEDLTRALDGIEAAQSDGGDDRGELGQLEVVLHHHHLPQMDGAGVISYDPDSGEVESAANTDVAYALVEGFREREVD